MSSSKAIITGILISVVSMMGGGESPGAALEVLNLMYDKCEDEALSLNRR